MSELELRLAELRDALAFPNTPDLLAGVALERGAARRRRLRPLAVALAVALVLAAGVLVLSPGARSAFLELFHLRGATVERVEQLPPVEPTPLDLGERVGRAEAERRVGFRLLDLGEPDAIYARDGVATLVYGPLDRPRLVLSELRGAVWEGLLKKVSGTGTRVELVRVNGERGLFLSGAEHYVMFLDERGNVADEPTALAGNTLLWNRGELLLRLEADVGRAEALELARAVR
jgi:hypothetical protein